MQDWIVKRQLTGIPGVVEESSFGGYVKQYEVSICLLYTSRCVYATGVDLRQTLGGLHAATGYTSNGRDERGGGVGPVSYTHLDVYKRQAPIPARNT